MQTLPKTTDKPADWREARRLRAWQLHQQGYSQQQIADVLGVTQGAVSQWLARARKGGIQALKTRKPTGAPPRLSWEQRAQLPRLLARGAESFGFRGAVWTAERVADVIEREYGVRYHRSRVACLLHSCGWSQQKPKCRATQRDEEAIQDWCETRLPALKKGPTRASTNSCL